MRATRKKSTLASIPSRKESHMPDLSTHQEPTSTPFSTPVPTLSRWEYDSLSSVTNPPTNATTWPCLPLSHKRNTTPPPLSFHRYFASEGAQTRNPVVAPNYSVSCRGSRAVMNERAPSLILIVGSTRTGCTSIYGVVQRRRK